MVSFFLAFGEGDEENRFFDVNLAVYGCSSSSEYLVVANLVRTKLSGAGSNKLSTLFMLSGRRPFVDSLQVKGSGTLSR